MSDFAEGYAVGQSNNGMAGLGEGGWIWIILLFALFGGNWGGNFGGNGGAQMNYELGRAATSEDVASGFATSAIMNNQRDTQLTLASMQNFINQGFSGLNTTIIQNGYETRNAISDIGYRLQDCCCQTQRAIEGVNYNMAKSVCELGNKFDAGIQRLVDMNTTQQLADRDRQIAYMTQKSLIAENNTYLLGELRPIAKPSYITCSPFESAFGRGNNCNNCF